VSAVFRDGDGEELDRGSTPVGPVAPGATESFTVSGDAARPAASCDITNVDAQPT
jgi:hypothetical protein